MTVSAGVGATDGADAVFTTEGVELMGNISRGPILMGSRVHKLSTYVPESCE